MIIDRGFNMHEWNIPNNVKELFSNGDQSYSIRDTDYSGDNIYAMGLFLDNVGIPEEMIETNDGTQVILFDGKTRLCVNSGGLGDFHLHGFEVTVLK